MIKPDGVQRGLVGEIIGRFERKGLKLVGLKSVVPSQEMKGLYNIGAPAISKYALLELIADVYQKSINVIKQDSVVVNRSLDSTKFFKESGYKLPSWREMIEAMHSFS